MIGTTVDGDLAGRLHMSQDKLFGQLAKMGFNTVRLGAYWNQIQPNGPSSADFSVLDAQLAAARKAGLKVILTVGAKAPSWPEYHVPSWAAPNARNGADVGQNAAFRRRVLAFDRMVVEHVRGQSSIVMFQVENEPFDPSGPHAWRIDPQMVAKEAAVIRSADPAHRPLMINVWSQPRDVLGANPFGTVEAAAKIANVVGLDVYGDVGAPRTKSLAGRIQAWLQTWLFPTVARWIIRADHKRAMVAELEADNWGSYKVSPADIARNFQQVRKEGYSDILFWRQSTVEQALASGNDALLKTETRLARSDRRA